MEEEAVFVKEESRDFGPLENILHNTHRTLYLMNVEPINEQDVKAALYKYL